MIDSTSKKRIIAVQKGNQISIKVYSFGDLSMLEDYLEDNLQIVIDSFKPIEDEKRNEIGCEVFYTTFHHIQSIQATIDELE